MRDDRSTRRLRCFAARRALPAVAALALARATAPALTLALTLGLALATALGLGRATALAAAPPVPAPAAPEDTVYISANAETGGYSKWTGEVLQYTGVELRIRLSGDLERSFPAERVLRIETRYGPEHVEADARFAQGKFDEALALYGPARRSEPREWVRRRITAQMVWCYRALGRLEEAGEEFRVLVQSDPATPYFACIPLAWMPSPASIILERTARQWLDQDEIPAAVLLGASHLMSTSSRAAALAKLKRLTTGAQDGRIAFLALAQTWRAAVVTADEEQVKAWNETIERMPESLRAGPYYVLGQARAQRQAWEQAALAWLRIPILYPEDRPLAARALLDAGHALERLGQADQAARLYGELIRDYPDDSSAGEARARLKETGGPNESLSKDPQKTRTPFADPP
jgi:tetratricopeptide (TPR) repeat protein